MEPLSRTTSCASLDRAGMLFTSSLDALSPSPLILRLRAQRSIGKKRNLSLTKSPASSKRQPVSPPSPMKGPLPSTSKSVEPNFETTNPFAPLTEPDCPDPPASSPATPKEPKPPLIYVKNICRQLETFLDWTGVAVWRWLANDDTCGICRVSFEGCCPDCKLPGDDCPLVWGQCSHCFHIHCIMKWLNSQQVNQQCPMCRQEWKFRE